MKVIVISDSHGNIASLKHVLGFSRKIRADAIVHCGDWNNLKAVEMVLESKIPLYAVLGNADIDPMVKRKLKVESKGFGEKVLSFKLGDRKIDVVHNFVMASKLFAAEVIFCGHKHFKWEKVIDGVKVIAPGALHSIKPSFAVYDTDTNKVEFFDLGR